MRTNRIAFAALAVAAAMLAGCPGDNERPLACGNGKLEPLEGEKCDRAILAGQPGACPHGIADCDDGDPCTTDAFGGSADSCSAECTHTAKTADPATPDQCCPQGANADTDADCVPTTRCGNGVLDDGEACDIAIASGAGACPTDCSDGIACTDDVLSGTGCQATCSNPVITAIGPADLCCPAGATSGTDPDCSPSCGNGVVDPGETCDSAITTGAGRCPTAADCNDSNSCTMDSVVGGACAEQCMNAAITAVANGDGCCPPGANANIDSDCSPVCGNGAVESGEFCDTAIPAGTTGACPTSCADTNACTTDSLVGVFCQARCVFTPVTATSLTTSDGCCPAGIGNANNDIDCKAVCGNGVHEPAAGEACDIGISSGAGKCPATAAECGDGNACTTDDVTGTGCARRCTYTAVTSCSMTADGCCPAGCTGLSDADCSLTCGNGTVEASETCDTLIDPGDPGACPQGPEDCDDGNACTADDVQSAGTCNATCVHGDITTPSGATMDGCCPTGANANNDADCPPACGNGVVEYGELCDTGITSGNPGACPVLADCDDGDSCTIDSVSGAGTCNAECEYDAIFECCGDGRVEGAEQCDTAIPMGLPGACPTSCDDGNGCTLNNLVGTACQTHCEFPDNPSTSCCGDGVVEVVNSDGTPVTNPETCDTAIMAGMPGACENWTCIDKYSCTNDSFILLDGNACRKICVHETTSRVADGCCPPLDRSAGLGGTDPDCVCGDGMVQNSPPTFEQCDDANTENADACNNSCVLNLVPNSDAPMGETPVGAPCSMASDCSYAPADPSGTCITPSSIPGITSGFLNGYCSKVFCDPNPADPDGNPLTYDGANFQTCPQLAPYFALAAGVAQPNAVCVQPTGAPFPVCAALCNPLAGNEQCRHAEGDVFKMLGVCSDCYAYRCVQISAGAGICAPRLFFPY